jgi:hypothetical protein
MTDTWVPSPPQPPGPPPPDILPPANAWAPTTPCAAADSPSIVPSVVITGVPAIIASAAAGKYVWSITLNDGATPANFSIDRYDATGALIDHPIEISGANGDVTLTHDPTQPLGAATKEYVDNTGLREAPMDNYPYARYMATWERLPQSYMPEAPNNGQRFGRFNSTWQADAIQTDAPSDGGTYGRMNGGWNAALATTGGTITGNLTVNQVLTVQGSNSMVLNAPVTGGSQRTILGMGANVARWALTLGDGTAEGLNNTGANFSLAGYSTTGAFLGNWLTIARADGSAVFNGGVTMNYGLSVNGLFAVNSLGNVYLPGGNPNDALTTNGAGLLAWAPRLADAPSDGQFYTRQNAAWAIAPGGMADAPNDGTAYARKSAGWAHLTHTDITDWTATLAPYALIVNVPVASTAPPIMDGTAAPGSSAAFSRGDHVHPTDTSRAAVTALPPASAVVPLADGVGAVGVSTAYARADHVHPLPPQAMGDNRIINGDMRINQRGVASGTAINLYTIDRWYYGASTAGALTWAQQSTPGLPGGFANCLTATVTTAHTPVAADTFYFYQPIEADFVSDFQWPIAGQAQPVTLSFWARSSLTGTFGGAVATGAAGSAYPFTYSLPTANAWTKIVVPIPAPTAGTWVMSGSGAAINVFFDLGSGANYRAPANAWIYSGNYTAANGSVSLVATQGATFNVTGVKLEIGSVATPFNRQSLAKSQADCERYFRWLPFNMRLVAAGASNNMNQSIMFPMMRAAPTIGVLAADPNAGTTAGVNASASTMDNITPYSVRQQITSAAAGDCYSIGYRSSASAEL